MKYYKFVEKNSVIKGHIHKVIIPEKHSTIDAMVLETKDLNAWDSWANITRYHTICLVKNKGENKWDTLYDGLTSSFSVNGIFPENTGVNHILFLLEKESVRNRITKRQRIKELKNRIKKDTWELKEIQVLKK